LVLNPSKCSNSNTTKHGWDSSEFDHQFRKKSSKRRIPHYDSIMEGISWKPHAPSRRANCSISPQKATSGKLVVLPNCLYSSTSRQGQVPASKKPATHYGRSNRFMRTR
jgi:hypothetical protein